MVKMTKLERVRAIADFLEAASANMDATPEGIDPEQFLEDSVNFLRTEANRLDKRAKAPKAPTKTQRENVEYKQEIMRALNSVESARATDVAKGMDVSVQKVTALMRQLVSEGLVLREVDGKVVKFRTNEARYTG